MSRRKRRSPPPVQLVNQLRVHRIEPGTSWSVRMLSEGYGGCFVHWYRGESVYCHGNACLPAYHRTLRVWKGYCAAEVYHQKLNRWIPVTLEITSGLELQMRGKFARGQVWELSRNPDEIDRPEAVRGELVETHRAELFPPAFDYTRPLLTIYNLDEIDLTHENPAPPKLFLPLSDGPAPRRLSDMKPAPTADKPATADQVAEVKRRLNLNGVPTSNGNGHKS